MSKIRPHVILIMEGGVIQQVFAFNPNLGVVVIDRDKDVDPDDVAYCAELGGLVFPVEVEPISAMKDHVWEIVSHHFEDLEVVDGEADGEVPAETTGGGDRPAAG